MLDSNVKLLDNTLPDHTDGSGIADDWGWSAYLFMTQKQLWLHRAVFDCKENFRQADIGAMVSYIFTYRDSRTIRML